MFQFSVNIAIPSQSTKPVTLKNLLRFCTTFLITFLILHQFNNTSSYHLLMCNHIKATTTSYYLHIVESQVFYTNTANTKLSWLCFSVHCNCINYVILTHIVACGGKEALIVPMYHVLRSVQDNFNQRNVAPFGYTASK